MGDRFTFSTREERRQYWLGSLIGDKVAEGKTLSASLPESKVTCDGFGGLQRAELVVMQRVARTRKK